MNSSSPAPSGGPAPSGWLRAAMVLVRWAAAMLPDPRQRARHREEWLADVTGAADLDLSPLRVALGTVGAAARLAATSSKGSMIMQPVGPLALAMRLVGGSHARQRAVALAALLTLTLLGGLTLLITS